MSKNTKIILITMAAFLVLVWGFKEKEDDGGGYSDETTYFSEQELEERRKTVEQMAQMRGETPPPTATPKPEKENKEEKQLDERFASIPMELTTGSYSVKSIGYDPEQQILLAEYNLTGMLYAFFDVPQQEYDALLAAENFDKWFEVMIMKKFDFEQLN